MFIIIVKSFERSKENIRRIHLKEIEIKNSAIKEANSKLSKTMKRLQKLELENINLKSELKNVFFIENIYIVKKTYRNRKKSTTNYHSKK